MDRFKLLVAVLIITLLLSSPASALKPSQILIIANSNCPESVRIAEYYCQKRAVPKENIFVLPLQPVTEDFISRADYDKQLAEPIRIKLSSPELAGKIKCLLTMYGIPLKVGDRGVLKSQERTLQSLQSLAEQKNAQLDTMTEQLSPLLLNKISKRLSEAKLQSAKDKIKTLSSAIKLSLSRIKSVRDSSEQKELFGKWLQIYQQFYGKSLALKEAKRYESLGGPVDVKETIAQTRKNQSHLKLIRQAQREDWDPAKRLQTDYYDSLEQLVGIRGTLPQVLDDIDRLKGKYSSASVDSELSMVLFDNYELYKGRPNELKERVLWFGVKTLMISRLDGPGERIPIGLIDKAVAAEKAGLKGIAYFDSGFPDSRENIQLFEQYNKSLWDLAPLIKTRTKMQVVEERSKNLFEPGQCPQTALYCGWYSLKKYVDAFDFVEGAIGYHIASFEAANLRDPANSQWCPAMLKDGITATLGAVDEPHLEAFPDPKMFFLQLLNGRPLVEAYYRTKRFNSWRMVLIGDPLYTPFPKSRD